MTVQTLKLGRERFVLLKERDYRQLKAKAARQNGTKRARKLTAQDRADIAEARRRLNDPNDRVIPYQEARKQLGLA